MAQMMLQETAQEVAESEPYVLGVDGVQIPRSSLKMAGLTCVQWARNGLDKLGRAAQAVLVLADGSFDTLDFWSGLPQRVILAVRTARNRALYWLPKQHAGPGRPASYDPQAPHPSEWLHKGRSWQKRDIPVRGKLILMKFQVIGPVVRAGLPHIPMFLIVVKGMHRKVGSVWAYVVLLLAAYRAWGLLGAPPLPTRW